MMALLTFELRTGLSGCASMFASFGSLAEALSEACVDEPVEVESGPDGITFAGRLIARMSHRGPEDGVVYFIATPTFAMPLFAQEICRIAPGVKVRWEGGWPHFSANGGDDCEEPDPDPATGERILA